MSCAALVGFLQTKLTGDTGYATLMRGKSLTCREGRIQVQAVYDRRQTILSINQSLYLKKVLDLQMVRAWFRQVRDLPRIRVA